MFNRLSTLLVVVVAALATVTAAAPSTLEERQTLSGLCCSWVPAVSPPLIDQPLHTPLNFCSQGTPFCDTTC